MDGTAVSGSALSGVHCQKTVAHNRATPTAQMSALLKLNVAKRLQRP